MTRITVSRVNYKFDKYQHISEKLTPHTEGYKRKLYKDHNHVIPSKITLLDNVSDIIYGKCK